ncbi:hypothetical protein GCM10011386_40620 [Parapedobacter defluvii]|uniref:Uncharacterized protein n=1 Tax=Parapedobacter defluvii TaxID=2045106 RepID=A0ABQ1MW59_9SPHI|nr:hypothetical protein [Parapedobacter defluvii]RQP17919.1 MAG: hypothetical protein EAS52_07215 [Parapedobacter sp.]GGC44186.1 hypothetical protein GCM10011386_40620 [Parapedobacter defluvii]
MKPFVLSALICVAAVGNSAATAHTVSHVGKESNHKANHDQKNTEAFKQTIAFHQRNVDALWAQYGRAETRIRESHGNHAELERDRTFFVGVYQRDIEKGVRVEESKKIIAQIEADYVKKHAQRDTYEKKQLAQLQSQLKRELLKEQKYFEKSKRKYADLVDEETRPLLQEAEQHFAAAIERVNRFSDAGTTIASK